MVDLFKFLSFMSHSNLYLSFATFLSAFSTSLILSAPLDFKIPFILFCGVFSFYLMNRYWELKEDELTYPERSHFIKNKKKIILALILIFYGCTIFLTYLKSLNAIFSLFFVTFLLIFYTLRIKGKRLKDIFLVKNLIISFAWAFIFTIFFITESLNINKEFLIIFFFLGAFTFINTVIFDMRDIEGDKKNKIQTLPVKLGLEKSRKIIFLINFFLTIVSFLIWMYNFLPYSFIIFFTSIYLYLPIYLSKNERKLNLVADILGDGWIIFYGALGLLLWL